MKFINIKIDSCFDFAQLMSDDTRYKRGVNFAKLRLKIKLKVVFLVKFSLVEKWESRSNKAKLFSRKYPRHKEEKTCALKITGSPIKNWVR